MDCIGFLELNSIAKGIEAADAMLKAAEVRLLDARPSCPGKYHAVVCGEVAAVRASMDAGASVGGGAVIDEVVIPRVHPQVIEAVACAASPERADAVGILEFFGVAASIEAADAAVKAADVELIEIRLGTGIGGKSFFTMTGSVSAVEAAADAGAATVSADGSIVSRVVIPNPHPDIFKSLY